MAVTDLHQHLWPDDLLQQLARRTAPPRLRRDDRGWILELAGEPPAPADLFAHDPTARILRARADRVDRAVVAPSTPLGIETLPAREAQPLLDSFHAGVLGLGSPFSLWASVPLAAPSADEIADLLDRGAAGLCLPAEAMASPEAPGRLGPLLERLTDHDAPLLVHPGQAGADPRAPPGGRP